MQEVRRTTGGTHLHLAVKVVLCALVRGCGLGAQRRVGLVVGVALVGTDLGAHVDLDERWCFPAHGVLPHFVVNA